MRRITLLLMLFLGCLGSTVAQTFPQVVAQVSLTGQSTTISKTPIYTPAADGIYRANVHMVLTTASHNQEFWYAYVQWFDGVGHERTYGNTPLPTNLLPPDASISYSYTFPAAGSQPIEYLVQGGLKGTVYSVYITLEQLQ